MIEIIEKKDLKLRQNKYKNVIKFKNLIKARRTRKNIKRIHEFVFEQCTHIILKRRKKK